MYKTKNRGFKLMDIAALIIGAVLHGISTAILGLIFYAVQTRLFMDNKDVLFLHSSITNYIVPVGLAFVFIFLWMRIVANDRGFLLPVGKIKYISLSLACLVITLVIAFADIFNYTRINDEGLYTRTSIVSKEEYISWDSVDSVQVFHCYSARRRARYNYYYKYQLILKNDEIIDMEWAEDFKKWDKVIFMHKYFKNIGLKMSVEKIDIDTLEKIKSRYTDHYGDHVEDVLKEIFEYRD